MATSIIDGTVEEASYMRGFYNMQVWGPIVFRLRDGRTKEVRKVIVESSLVPWITPGNSGRFYLYSAIDHRGIHGVRTDQGEAHYAFAKNNEVAALICGALGLFMVIMWIAFEIWISSWGIICLVIGVVFYFLSRNIRAEAERQFDADSHYVAPPAAVPAQ